MIHVSNNTLAALGLPRGVSRSDLDDSSRESRIERRIGRKLTLSEAYRCKLARNEPTPLLCRGRDHANGFRLVVSRGRLVLAKNGRDIFGYKVGVVR